MRLLAAVVVLTLCFPVVALAQSSPPKPPEPFALRWPLKVGTLRFELVSRIERTVRDARGEKVIETEVAELTASVRLELKAIEEVVETMAVTGGRSRYEGQIPKDKLPKVKRAKGTLVFEALRVVPAKGEALELTAEQLRDKEAAVVLTERGVLSIELGPLDEEPLDEADLKDHLGGLFLRMPYRLVRPKWKAGWDTWIVDVSGENHLLRVGVKELSRDKRAVQLEGAIRDDRVRLRDRGRIAFVRRATLSAKLVGEHGKLDPAFRGENPIMAFRGRLSKLTFEVREVESLHERRGVPKAELEASRPLETIVHTRTVTLD